MICAYYWRKKCLKAYCPYINTPPEDYNCPVNYPDFDFKMTDYQKAQAGIIVEAELS